MRAASRPLVDTPAHTRGHNLAHSLTLLAGVGLALGLSAHLLLGPAGVLAVACLIVALALVAPHMPAETLLRLYGARFLGQDDSQISSVVDVLAWRAGLLQRPDLYVIPSMTLHAFAAGTTKRPAIALSEGLIRRLSLRELTAVIAHEISHIRNGDLWIMSLADAAARLVQAATYVAIALAVYNAVAYFSARETFSWLAISLLYLTPASLNLLQLALSRAREFEADRLAVALTGDPVALTSALRSVETYTGHVWEDLMPNLPARRVPEPSLLRTHPPSEERVARLALDVPDCHSEPLIIIERPMISLVGMGPATLRPRYRWPGLWY